MKQTSHSGRTPLHCDRTSYTLNPNIKYQTGRKDKIRYEVWRCLREGAFLPRVMFDSLISEKDL